MYTGHHYNKAGLAHHHQWITPQTDLHGHNWVISTDQIHKYRSDGWYRSIPGETCSQGVECTPRQLSINLHIHSTVSQLSNWLAAETLVYDTELSFGKIEEIEAWLNFKYRVTPAIGTLSSPPIPSLARAPKAKQVLSKKGRGSTRTCTYLVLFWRKKNTAIPFLFDGGQVNLNEAPYESLLRGWYDARSFDLDTNRWMDKSGSNRHSNETEGSGFQRVIHTFPNGEKIPIIKGTADARIRFPNGLFDDNNGWTFFHVTKYGCCFFCFIYARWRCQLRRFFF